MIIRNLCFLLLASALFSGLDTTSVRADEDVPAATKKPVSKKSSAPKSDIDEQKATTTTDDDADDKGPPPVSVVLLQKSLPKLTEQQVAAKVKAAWGLDLSEKKDGEENENGFVVKGGPGFIIKAKDSQYMMIMSAEPYLKQDVIDDVAELRLKEMLKDHKAWLSVDLLSGDEKLTATAKKAEWKKVAALAAELLNDKTVGVILPEPNVIVVSNEETANLLKEKDPIKALKDSLEVAVVGTASDDPEMDKAVEDARKSWSEFVKAFEAKEDGTENFGVKFPFDAPENKEFMWIEVTSIDDEFVNGRLANDPVWVKDLKLGSKVKKKVSEVADWMYLKDGEMVGGYSVKILLKRQAEDQESK
jgi:uncharacterized protein YegJ (DUF2314 family)